MPSTNNTNSLRAAQILLSGTDRELQSQLQERLSGLGLKSVGPTGLFRAGLIALTRLADAELSNLVGEIDSRPSLETISKNFDTWCADLAVRVESAPPELGDVYSLAQPGIFSNDDRVVAITVMEDGRCLIFGREFKLRSPRPGVDEPARPQLFPGSLAVKISMNDEGARLAADAIVAWLSYNDESLPAIRSAFQKHKASPLR